MTSKQPPVEGKEGTAGKASGFSYYAADVPEHQQENDDHYMALSRDAYRDGVDWFDASVRRQQERNQSLFNSKHPKGSKYWSDQYRKKSKIFRPKVRTAIKKREASVGVAFFSTSDVVHCAPVNDRDEAQQLAAEVHMALLNYRLDQDQSWFLTCVGGFQDADKQGVVAARVDWLYSSAQTAYEEEYEDGFGNVQKQTVIEDEVTEDRPNVTLLPLENLKVSPSCDWRDPINTSPYVIEDMPTYVHEIKSRMASGQYRQLDDGVLKAAVKQDWDSIRKAREGDERLDRYDNEVAINEFQIVWVRRYIMKIDGQDWCWDTLGGEFLLSDVKPLNEVYLHGLRPYVWGRSNIETHNPYPAGMPQLLDSLQSEANDLANLRLDNLKLALNKRYLLRRGGMTDVRSLLRNVSGSVTMTGDPDADVKVVETRDVTGSSYQEQDRLNLDMDDLSGSFQGGSVMANRKMNETVGGMSLTADAANEVKELDLRTYAETFVEPVMRHIIALEAAYETDMTVLRVVGEQVMFTDNQTGQKSPLSVKEVLQLLKENTKVRVNVGFNSTNPAKRIEKLALALKVVFDYMPFMQGELDGGELVNEVMGAVGHDGERFFPSLGKDGPNPQVAQLQQQVQQLTQALEMKQVEAQAKLQDTQIREQGALQREQMKLQTQLQIAREKGQLDAAMSQMKNRLEQYDRQLASMKAGVEREELELQKQALAHTIKQAETADMREDRRMNFDMTTKVAGAAADRSPEEGPMDLKGNDKAGVMARENYDLIPQNIL